MPPSCRLNDCYPLGGPAAATNLVQRNITATIRSALQRVTRAPAAPADRPLAKQKGPRKCAALLTSGWRQDQKATPTEPTKPALVMFSVVPNSVVSVST